MVQSEENLGKLYNFNELYENGVRAGDVVATPALETKNGTSWDYWLLREGLPKELNVSLCCYKDPRKPGWMHLCGLGFHWCGDTKWLKFRLLGESEIKDFVDTCISTLKEPIDENSFYGMDDYAQVLHSLIRHKLISYFEAEKLDRELKKIHGVSLISHFRKNFAR